MQRTNETMRVPTPSRKPRESLEDRLARMARMTSVAGWDEPRSKAIPRAHWESVSGFLRTATLEIPNLPEPFVSPCGDGSIHVWWADASRAFGVEAFQDCIYWSEERGGDEIEDGECDTFGELLARVR